MDTYIAMELVNNAALLMALAIVYELSYIIPIKWSKLIPAFNGFLIALIGVSIMSLPFQFDTGISFDTRTILISVTALNFSAITTIVASVILIIYRIALGGAGLWMGVLIIITSACIGIIWKHFLLPKNIKFRWINIYLFGLVVHIVMLVDVFTLPQATSLHVLRDLGIPVMLVFPVGTVLLSLLLLHQKERKESLAKIVEAEEKYQSIFNNAHGVMLLIDPKTGQIIDANLAAASFYGWSIQTLKSMNISQINTLSTKELNDEMQKSELDKKNLFFFQHRRAFGDQVEVEVYSGPIKLKSKVLIYSIVHDISDRVAVNKALLESENRFRLLVENAPEAIFIETKGKFSYINQYAISLFGAESAQQLTDTLVLNRCHPDYRDIIEERMLILKQKKEAVPTKEEVFLKLDGTPVTLEVNAVPINYNDVDGALVFARDITERKNLEHKNNEIEAQLRQQQKLEAIGTLAGGVAHEINNPINGIMNYAQLILDEHENLNDNQIEYAKEIICETERVAVIVKNLLQFSRQEKQSHSYASIYDIINQTVSLIKTVVKGDQIRLIVDLDENLPEVKCRSQQIQQVLMNLLTNARDALNEKYADYHEDKLIRVSCSQYTKEERRWVQIKVEDLGNGIPIELQEKIFEPFFSTKPKDIGTGLGLAISFGIVKDHHGKISLDTKEGYYTKFLLDLPVDNGWTL